MIACESQVESLTLVITMTRRRTHGSPSQLRFSSITDGATSKGTCIDARAAYVPLCLHVFTVLCIMCAARRGAVDSQGRVHLCGGEMKAREYIVVDVSRVIDSL